MGGFFGSVGKEPCVTDIFYGTDYHSHLGTKRAGMVTFDRENGFNRVIHSIERDYFRSKFEDQLDGFIGNSGVGVVSDTDPQPIIVNSHLGRYAVVTVAKINNIREIAEELLAKKMHFRIEFGQDEPDRTGGAADKHGRDLCGRHQSCLQENQRLVLDADSDR